MIFLFETIKFLCSASQFSYPSIQSRSVSVDIVQSTFQLSFILTSSRLQTEFTLISIFSLRTNLQLRSIQIKRKSYFRYSNYISVVSLQDLQNSHLNLVINTFAFNSQLFISSLLIIQLQNMLSDTFTYQVNIPADQVVNYKLFMCLVGFQLNMNKFGDVGACVKRINTNQISLQFDANQFLLSKKLIYSFVLYSVVKFNLDSFIFPNNLLVSQINTTYTNLRNNGGYLQFHGFQKFTTDSYPLSINSDNLLVNHTFVLLSFRYSYSCVTFEFCANCGIYGCLSCQFGYYLSDQACIKCQQGCNQCTQLNAKQCYIQADNNGNKDVNPSEPNKQPDKICKLQQYYNRSSNSCQMCNQKCKICISLYQCTLCKQNFNFVSGVCFQKIIKKNATCFWPQFYNGTLKNCSKRLNSIPTQFFNKIQSAKSVAKIIGPAVSAFMIMGFGNLIGNLIGLSVIVKSHLIFSPLLQLELGFFLVFFNQVLSSTLIPDSYMIWVSSKLSKRDLDSVELSIFPNGYYLILTISDLALNFILLFLRLVLSNLFILIYNYLFKKKWSLFKIKKQISQFIKANSLEIIFLATNQLRIHQLGLFNQTSCMFAFSLIVFVSLLRIIRLLKHKQKMLLYNKKLLIFSYIMKVNIILLTIIRRNSRQSIFMILFSNVMAIFILFVYCKSFKKFIIRSSDFLLSLTLLVANYFALQNRLLSWVVYFSISSILLNSIFLSMLSLKKIVNLIYQFFKFIAITLKSEGLAKTKRTIREFRVLKTLMDLRKNSNFKINIE